MPCGPIPCTSQLTNLGKKNAKGAFHAFQKQPPPNSTFGIGLPVAEAGEGAVGGRRDAGGALAPCREAGCGQLGEEPTGLHDADGSVGGRCAGLRLEGEEVAWDSSPVGGVRLVPPCHPASQGAEGPEEGGSGGGSRRPLRRGCRLRARRGAGSRGEGRGRGKWRAGWRVGVCGAEWDGGEVKPTQKRDGYGDGGVRCGSGGLEGGKR